MKFNWMMGLPMDQAGDGTGDGGSGGGAGADGQQQPLTLDAILAGLTEKLPALIEPLVTKHVNGLDRKWEKQFGKQRGAAASGSGTDSGDSTDDGTSGDGQGSGKTGKGAKGGKGKSAADEFASERERELNDRIAQLEKDREERERKSMEVERDAEIKTAISKFTFAEDADTSVPFEFYKAKASRDDDGNLVIDGMALASYIKEHVPRAFKGMLAKRDIGGSGSRSSSASGKGTGITIDRIRPGMSADDEAAARNTLTALLAQQRAAQ